MLTHPASLLASHPLLALAASLLVLVSMIIQNPPELRAEPAQLPASNIILTYYHNG